MNNRLSELVSIHVEAIDDVLARVARDRRRVENLLEEVESTELRQYLQEWLWATPLPVSNEDHLVVSSSNDETLPENPTSTSSLGLEDVELEEEPCCSRDCWKDDDRSFWDVVANRPRCLNDCRNCYAMNMHHRRRVRKAYGVPYEWATEATTAAADGWCNGQWDWVDKDNYFQGRPLLGDLDPVLQHFYTRQHALRGMVMGTLHQVGLISESDNDFSLLFGDNASSVRSCLPTVDQVSTKAGGGCSLVYDLVFCAADLSYVDEDGNECPVLRHHRTGKGTLALSVQDPQDESSLEGNHNNPLVLRGRVQMDPSSMLDTIPSGGSFSFCETSRQERLVSDFEKEEWHHSSTSLLFVTTTSEDQNNKNYEAAKGEVKAIGQRTALFSKSDTDDILQYSRHRFSDASLADERMERYHQKRCLWMHRHTQLPVEVIHRIASFVSPPPVLYLEKGDLVLDMDWGPALKQRVLSRGDDNRNQEEGEAASDVMALSCLVFRPRTEVV